MAPDTRAGGARNVSLEARRKRARVGEDDANIYVHVRTYTIKTSGVDVTRERGHVCART